ncbi:MAG: hypothetical protein HYU97_07150 [Deltaproteobacteria bacterium]|nr:hypothetical protein [Deltaproteobacteria bacterium]
MAPSQEIEIKLGDWISNGFKLFGNQWQQWCLVSLVALLIMFGSMLCLFIPLLFVSGALMHSMFYIAFKNLKGESFSVQDVFYGFKNRYWDFTKLMMIITGVSLLLFVIPYGMFIGGVLMAEKLGPLFAFGGFGIFFLAILCFVVLSFYFSPRIMLMLPIMVDKGLPIRESYHLADSLCRKKFWWLLLFSLIANFISSVGIYVCYIGYIGTFPLFYTITIAAYQDLLMKEAPPAA